MLSGQTANQSWQQPAAAPQPVPPTPPQPQPQPVQPAAPKSVRATPTIPILEDDAGGYTAPLKGNPAATPGRRFVITEDTMVIHTNDVV